MLVGLLIGGVFKKLSTALPVAFAWFILESGVSYFLSVNEHAIPPSPAGLLVSAVGLFVIVLASWSAALAFRRYRAAR